jgi:Rap1a immunity proteins
MNQAKKALLTLLLIALPSGALADYFDGNELKKLSESQRDVDVTMYRGYVAGVQDSFNGVLFCVHPDVRLSQAAAVVSNYLARNPERWHLPARQLVGDALTKVFPCKK